MATVRLIDVFHPEIYGTFGSQDSPELLALIESGVLRSNDPVLTQLAGESSDRITVPYWNDLDASAEPNASTDNPDDVAVPQKISFSDWQARKAHVNNAWSAMDLARELTTPDPMAAMKARTNRYWTKQKQRRMLAVAIGVMRSSIANYSSDMVIDLTLNGTAADSAVTRVGSDAIVDAAFQMGDRYDTLQAIMTHSAVLKTMVKLNLIEQTPIGDGTIKVPTFLGKRVIVDDSSPVEVIGGNRVYTSVLFAPGAIAFAEGAPLVPAEVDRDMLRGNGGGMETFVERKTWLMHPMGHSWVETSAVNTANALVGGQPMEANLMNAARWERAVPSRKLLPLGFVRSYG